MPATRSRRIVRRAAVMATGVSLLLGGLALNLPSPSPPEDEDELIDFRPPELEKRGSELAAVLRELRRQLDEEIRRAEARKASGTTQD